jgi:hypothetical protein
VKNNILLLTDGVSTGALSAKALTYGSSKFPVLFNSHAAHWKCVKISVTKKAKK